MHICIRKLNIIGSDNGLQPGWCQAIFWTNAGILLTGPLGTSFSIILIEIYTFSFKKMHLKMSPGKWWPSCLCLNVLSFHYSCIPRHAAPDTLHYGTTFKNMKAWKATNMSLNYPLHWTGIVVILLQISSLAALEVVIMTTCCVASDGNFIKMTKFPFQMTTFSAASDENFC